MCLVIRPRTLSNSSPVDPYFTGPFGHCTQRTMVRNPEQWAHRLHDRVQFVARPLLSIRPIGEVLGQDDRVQVSQPRRNLQIKFTRPIAKNNDFVAYIDGIGKLDGKRCLLEWKTSSSRYPEEPEGLLSLDPQLVCYSWMTGIAEVAQVVFVRKRLVEVQYLRTTITDEQRQEFGHLVESTISRIESADFLPHSGIRFPQNPCSSCPYVGLCLGKQEITDARLVRRPGADSLDWLDELSY